VRTCVLCANLAQASLCPACLAEHAANTNHARVFVLHALCVPCAQNTLVTAVTRFTAQRLLDAVPSPNGPRVGALGVIVAYAAPDVDFEHAVALGPRGFARGSTTARGTAWFRVTQCRTQAFAVQAALAQRAREVAAALTPET